MNKTMIAAMTGIMMMGAVAPSYAAAARTATGNSNSAPVAMAAPEAPFFNTEEGAEASEKTTSLISSLIKGNKDMKELIKAAEIAVDMIAKQVPAVKFIAGPFLQMMNELCESENPETTLDDISQKLDGISKDIEDAKKDLIDAMSTANDMSDFVKIINTFDSSYRELIHQIAHISGYKDYTREEKDIQLSEMIGEREKWTLTDNVVSKLTVLGEYLCGEKKLSSTNKDIYEAILNHFSKSVCFGKEAMEKTDRFIADAMALYLEGTTQMINCIMAERSHLLRLGTKDAKCDAEYCEKKIAKILEQVQKVNKTIENFKKNSSPVEFYFRKGGKQTNIKMEALAKGVNFNCKEALKDILPGGKTLTKEQMEYIVDYAKEHYPEKTLQEFLEYVGFNFIGSTYEGWVQQCKENEQQIRRMLNDRKLKAEQKAILKLFLDPTVENYNKVGHASVQNAYIMIDQGDCSTSNIVNMGCSRRFYYNGVRLNSKDMEIVKLDYLRKTDGSSTKTNLAKEDMFYLVRK